LKKEGILLGAWSGFYFILFFSFKKYLAYQALRG
jgi:hypothetical protein